KDGVIVRLVRLNPDDDPWDVEIKLEYPNPKDGPHFESFQSWLVNNDIYLEHRRTHAKRRTPQVGKQETLAFAHADVLDYCASRRPRLGKPGDYKVVYRTPGKIISIPVHFEFKNLRLP